MGGGERVGFCRACARRATTPGPRRRWDSACSRTWPIAARHALDALGAERVLILDWDVHHGNGTNAIFHASRDVLFASIHQYPFYPGTGALDRRRAPARARASRSTCRCRRDGRGRLLLAGGARGRCRRHASSRPTSCWSPPATTPTATTRSAAAASRRRSYAELTRQVLQPRRAGGRRAGGRLRPGRAGRPSMARRWRRWPRAASPGSHPRGEIADKAAGAGRPPLAIWAQPTGRTQLEDRRPGSARARSAACRSAPRRLSKRPANTIHSPCRGRGSRRIAAGPPRCPSLPRPARPGGRRLVARRSRGRRCGRRPLRPCGRRLRRRLLECSLGLRGGSGEWALGLGWGGVGRGGLLRGCLILVRVARELAQGEPERPDARSNDSNQGDPRAGSRRPAGGRAVAARRSSGRPAGRAAAPPRRRPGTGRRRRHAPEFSSLWQRELGRAGAARPRRRRARLPCPAAAPAPAGPGGAARRRARQGPAAGASGASAPQALGVDRARRCRPACGTAHPSDLLRERSRSSGSRTSETA